MYAGAVNRLLLLLFHEKTNRPSSLRALVGGLGGCDNTIARPCFTTCLERFNHASLHKIPASVSFTDAMHIRRSVSCVKRLADERKIGLAALQDKRR